jgi:hypothetical protein
MLISVKNMMDNQIFLYNVLELTIAPYSMTYSAMQLIGQ